MEQRQDIDLDGARIATRVLTPDGPSAGDIVICHGTPWSMTPWADLAARLGRTHRVHLWDMPGYGGSEMSPEIPVDLPAQMLRLGRLMGHWGLERPAVIAHDIGGAVALGAHLMHRVEYSSLLLINIVILEPWGSDFFRLVARHHEVFAQLPAALHAALVRAYIAGALATEVPDTSIGDLIRPWLGDSGQSAFYRQIAALDPRHTVPIVERLGEVRCAARIVWGGDDPWIPVEQAQRLAGALPGDPRVRVLSGVGHLAPVEAPEALATVIAEWLPGTADATAPPP